MDASFTKRNLIKNLSTILVQTKVLAKDMPRKSIYLFRVVAQIQKLTTFWSLQTSHGEKAYVHMFTFG